MASIMNVIGEGYNVYQGYTTYSDNRKNGKGAVVSGAKALAEYAAWELVPQIMMASMAIDVAKTLVPMAIQSGKKTYEGTVAGYASGLGNGNFQSGQNAYTMRQRGVQAINNSRSNARSVFGSEARRYYRGNVG